MAKKKTKFQEGLFRAAGRSHDVLTKTYKDIGQAYKDLQALENEAFGEPGKGDTTEVLGHKLRNYGARPHPEWLENGKLAGFRFDWKPLGPQYKIPSIEIPEGWFSVPKHPGVFRPHAASLPELAAMLDAITLPDLVTLPEIMGTSPVVTVQHSKGSYPRAYQAWPEVHIDYDHDHNISFVIDAPKDYKGLIFQPEDSVPMTEEQWWEFRSHYGDMYEPYGQRRPQGVTTPDAYQNKRRTNARPDHHYYLIMGRTLEIYKTFKEEQDKAAKARSKLMRDWGIAGSCSYRGSELVGASFKNDPGKGWVPQEGGFRGEYKVDETSPEGRRLKDEFSRLPQEPNLLDLQALLTPGETWMKYPMTSELWDLGVTVLEYPAKIGGKPIIPPPGAVEIPSQVYTWMHADRSDKMCGMKAPPMPPALRPDYDKFIALIKPKPAASPKPPKL